MSILFGEGKSKVALPAVAGFRNEIVNPNPSELRTKWPSYLLGPESGPIACF
jgi:hypothetical protein